MSANMKTIQNIRASLGLTLTALLVLAGAATVSAQNQKLYQTPGSPAWRDNYTGGSGCQFTVGFSNVVVSHLGYISTNTVTGLATNHYVGIFNSSKQLLVQVIVPAGTGADAYTNSFYWMPLDPPVMLTANTVYYVAALPYSGDGDMWGDSFTATFNSFFVGTNGPTQCHTAYGPGNATWPPAGLSTFGNGTTYCIEGMANFQIDQARVGLQTTNVGISAGQTLTVVGFATGAPTITYQWYTNNINTPLAGQTNAILTMPGATTNASGTYFLTASNSLGGEQSANVTVSVTAFPVGISKQPTNLPVFANYPASFSVTATGTPPISLQWSRNATPVPGATSSSLSLFTSLTNNGDVYSCLASNYVDPNPYTATSSNATLTVLAYFAQPHEFLHGHRSLATNNFAGLIGGQFTVGNPPVMVTHLGYFANGGTNLALSHHVGIFSANGSVLYASVVVPAG